MKYRMGLVVLFVLLSGLHVASIKKSDDPIGNTQTNPILFKEKKEEIKDGEKAAPAPSFSPFSKTRFFSESVVGQEDPIIPTKSSEATEEVDWESEEEMGWEEDGEEPLTDDAQDLVETPEEELPSLDAQAPNESAPEDVSKSDKKDLGRWFGD